MSFYQIFNSNIANFILSFIKIFIPKYNILRLLKLLFYINLFIPNFDMLLLSKLLINYIVLNLIEMAIIFSPKIQYCHH